MVPQVTAANRTSHSPLRLQRLRDLTAHLGSHIKGQDHVLPLVSSVLIRGELELANPRRPRGSLLLVGPTGVGKTETANVSTAYLCDGARPICFDMSEYQLQESVEKLLGENRTDCGLLGRALRGVTRGVVLFDEIEKAHPRVLDLYLQILEDARVTLANGETIDFRPFYIVFTSNIGSEDTMRMESAPFASVERTVLMRVRERLRPELLGRVNEIIVYARLGYPTQRAICDDMIGAERTRLAELGWKIDVDATAVEYLVRQGYHRTLGARPMRGLVERCLQEAIAADILRGGTGCGKLRVASVDGGLALE